MPHLKCAACKIRRHSAGRSADVVSELCPECGAPLEPVGELSEIIGFRSTTSREGAADAPGTHARTAEPADAFLARRRLDLARARIHAERSIEDAAGLCTEAIPLP